MMTKVATDRSEIIILTSDNPKSENPFNILNDMLSALGWTVQDYIRCCGEDFFLSLPNGHKLFVHDSRRLAVWAAITMAEEDDVVVVAGRGHETYQLLGNKRTYIDDKEECREALRYLKKLHLADQGEHKYMMAVQESMMSFFRRATVFQTPNASDKNNSNLMQHAK
ncbi:hypothetical protein AXF42_Ash001479 [Apostasia shenzhenica]|uniref:Uncharacterized protein n=1 Tax=Apostasia shenzhenica TaxID=1088818 RepID=A0A2I0AV09_9ASPA|nr:hypothetical protein AXF42_Ash001479 [Apostasia shenzhenica]